MGTDIHLFTERRRPGQVWEAFAARVLACWCLDFPDHPADCYWCKGTGVETGFHDRCYNAFAILADVRNGSGFAGCDTGDGFKVIAPPRGLPDDLSPELQSLFDDTYTEAESDALTAKLGSWPGDHTSSWLTLAELLTFPLDQLHTVIRGVVTREQFNAWDGKSPPKEYCSDISGGGVTVTAKEARAGVASSHVRISWTESYRQASGRLWAFVEGLRVLTAGEGYAPDDVRIVFNFDS